MTPEMAKFLIEFAELLAKHDVEIDVEMENQRLQYTMFISGKWDNDGNQLREMCDYIYKGDFFEYFELEDAVRRDYVGDLTG